MAVLLDCEATIRTLNLCRRTVKASLVGGCHFPFCSVELLMLRSSEKRGVRFALNKSK